MELANKMFRKCVKVQRVLMNNRYIHYEIGNVLSVMNVCLSLISEPFLSQCPTMKV